MLAHIRLLLILLMCLCCNWHTFTYCDWVVVIGHARFDDDGAAEYFIKSNVSVFCWICDFSVKEICWAKKMLCGIHTHYVMKEK